MPALLSARPPADPAEERTLRKLAASRHTCDGGLRRRTRASVIPRTPPPAPGWTADGHRVKTPLAYRRGVERPWVDGGLRIADVHEVTMPAPSRNSVNDQRFLALVGKSQPEPGRSGWSPTTCPATPALPPASG